MIIEAKNLEFSYNGRPPLFRNVNFSVERGQILTILGPNGAGKTTMLNCLANSLKPTGGEVLLHGKNICSLSLKTVAQSLGYVPQKHTAAYAYSVRDFVVMGRAPYLGMFQKPSDKDYDLADDMLRQSGLYHLADRPYTEISGGELQQATIVRAIIQQPEIIIFDEPTAHLDYGNQLRVIQMMRHLAEQGYAIIVTTHMPDHAILLDGQVGILGHDGQLTVGDSDEILQEELLRKLYRSDLHIIYLEKVHRRVCVAGNLASLDTTSE